MNQASQLLTRTILIARNNYNSKPPENTRNYPKPPETTLSHPQVPKTIRNHPPRTIRHHGAHP